MMDQESQCKLNNCWKNFTCADCGNKADLGYEIDLFPHCRKCYQKYYENKE